MKVNYALHTKHLKTSKFNIKNKIYQTTRNRREK